MVIDIYAEGKYAASFEPIPMGRRRRVVVPEGSEVLETTISGRSSKALFVPTNDPLQYRGWSAMGVLKAVRSGMSQFRLI